MKGIYYIKNIITKNVYIGSSKDIRDRFKAHRRLLKNGNHHCDHLQNSWNKYGSKFFKFGIIEECSDLIIREQFYLNNNEKLFNSRKIAGVNGYTKRNRTTYQKGDIPWNKGKKYDNTNHLKVPKRQKGSRINYSETRRNNNPDIYVYTQDGQFLGHWRSGLDLEEETKNGLILPISGRFSKPRRGVPIHILQNVNILKALRENKPYKGLIIKDSLQ